MANYYLPFGKYRGVDIRVVPKDYLLWLSTLDLRDPLRKALDVELRRRDAPPPPPPRQPPPRRACPHPEVARQVIATGLRHLARRHHPDVGGDHEKMVALNACADWLNEQCRS